MNSNAIEFLTSLPVGYMVPWFDSNIPDGFLPVDGQTLSKIEYPAAFSFLREIVTDLGDMFTLPNKDALQKMIPSHFGDVSSFTIILKIR